MHFCSHENVNFLTNIHNRQSTFSVRSFFAVQLSELTNLKSNNENFVVTNETIYKFVGVYDTGLPPIECFNFLSHSVLSSYLYKLYGTGFNIKSYNLD